MAEPRKPLGLKRLAFLLQSLKRSLDLSNTTLQNVTLENPTATGTTSGWEASEGDITSVVAGATSGVATLNVDLTEAAESAIADGDYIIFLDGGATGTQSKEAVHDLATLFAGAGLTATNSVIAVDAAQSNITSLGTLTTLTVDDITINGKVITMVGSTGDGAVFTVGTNGTLSIVTTDAAAAAANIQITADGTAELAGTTVTLDSGGSVNLETDALNVGNDGDTDVVVTFKGNTSDGVLTWMEDEDEFRFSDSVRGKYLSYTYHNYNYTGTAKHYIPINSTVDATDIELEYLHWLAPHDGKLVKIIVNADGDHAGSGTAPGSTAIGLHIDRNSTAAVTVTETLAQASAGVGVSKIFNFTSSNTFSAGQFIAVSVDATAQLYDMRVTCVWEYDTTT